MTIWQLDMACLDTSLFCSYEKESYSNESKNNSKYEGSAPLLFTEKEASKMPKQFRKLFQTNKVRAHVRKRADGLYEIRCMIDLKPIREYQINQKRNLEVLRY